MKKLTKISEKDILELVSQVQNKISIINYGSWYCVVNIKTGSRSTNGDHENADSSGELTRIVERFIYQTYNVSCGDFSEIGLTTNEFFKELLYLRDIVIDRICGYESNFIRLYNQSN